MVVTVSVASLLLTGPTAVRGVLDRIHLVVSHCTEHT